MCIENMSEGENSSNHHFLSFPERFYLLTYLSLLCPRAHRARTRLLHFSLSWAFLSSSPKVSLWSLISFSTVLCQVVFGRPGFLFPSGVHLRATLVILLAGFLNTCPIHRHLYLVNKVCISIKALTLSKPNYMIQIWFTHITYEPKRYFLNRL